MASKKPTEKKEEAKAKPVKKKYVAIRKGFINKIIEIGEVFHFEGKQGKWMKEYEEGRKPVPEKDEKKESSKASKDVI